MQDEVNLIGNTPDTFAQELEAVHNLDAVKDTLAAIDKAMEETDDDLKVPQEKIENEDNTEKDQEVPETVEQDETLQENEEGGVIDEKDNKPKLWKEKKKRYRLIAEKAELQKENDKLRELLSKAMESGKYHYTQNVYLDLETAKEHRNAALLAGDVDAFNKADEAYHTAFFKVNELKKWEDQMASRRSYQNDNTQQLQETEKAIIEDWFEQHPYLNQASSQYDQDLAQKVQKFAQQYDEQIMRGAVNDNYYSDKYFERMDNYIDSLRNKPKTTTTSNRNSGSAAFVGGVRNVRNGGESSNKPVTQVELSPLERRWAQDLGISEEQYKQSKLKTAQQQKK